MDVVVLRDQVIDYGVRTLWAALVVIIAVVLARGVRLTAMRALARHRAHGNATVLLGNLAQLLVLTVGALVVLAIYTQGAFGWILTSFSVLGIVIGLSLQDILKNFFAGLWVLVERPFRIGDTIQVAGHTGQIQEISFRTTQLRTIDGTEVIVPNAALMTDPVVNLSRYPQRRASVWIALPATEAGSVDTAAVAQALGEAGLAREPAPRVELRSTSDGRAHFQVTFWTHDHDGASAAAVAAIRSRFPDWDVHGA